MASGTRREIAVASESLADGPARARPELGEPPWPPRPQGRCRGTASPAPNPRPEHPPGLGTARAHRRCQYPPATGPGRPPLPQPPATPAGQGIRGVVARDTSAAPKTVTQNAPVTICRSRGNNVPRSPGRRRAGASRSRRRTGSDPLSRARRRPRHHPEPVAIPGSVPRCPAGADRRRETTCGARSTEQRALRHAAAPSCAVVHRPGPDPRRVPRDHGGGGPPIPEGGRAPHGRRARGTPQGRSGPGCRRSDQRPGRTAAGTLAGGLGLVARM